MGGRTGRKQAKAGASDAAASRAWRTWLVVSALVAVNLLIYGQVARHDFIRLDDDVYVFENPNVRDGLSWSGVTWAFTSLHGANWHPLTWLSHMLDADLFGVRPGAHHLVNLLLHTANSALVLLVFNRLTRSFWPSAFVAALFAVHPTHVESVAWIAERKDVLSTFFWLLTMGAYALYAGGARTSRCYALTLFGLTLGLLTKPMLVTLPLVLLLLDCWPLGRLSFSPRASARQLWSRAWPLVREKAPLLVLAVASSTVTVVAQRSGGAIQKLQNIPLGHRLTNAVVSYASYLGALVWPANLAVYYPLHADWPAWQVFVALLLLGSITAVTLRRARAAPYLAFGWLWYLGTLVPVIGLVQVGGQAMADRYTYVPYLGLFVILAWGAGDLAVRAHIPQRAVVAVAALALLALGIRSWQQVAFWRDNETLFRQALGVTTDNAVIQNNLGLVLSEQGRLDEAASHFTEVLRIRPDDVGADLSLGSVLARQGKDALALPRFQEALRLDPDNAGARTNLGLLLLRQGKLAQAMPELKRAVQLEPGNAQAQNNLGLALLVGGQAGEAAARFRAALRLKPTFPEAEANLRRAQGAPGGSSR